MSGNEVNLDTLTKAFGPRDPEPVDEFEGLPEWCRPGAEVYYAATHGWSHEDLTLHKATVERILKRDVVFRAERVLSKAPGQ